MNNLYSIANLIANGVSFSYAEEQEYQQWLEWERWAYCNYFQLKHLARHKNVSRAGAYAKHRFGSNWQHYLPYVRRVILESKQAGYLTISGEEVMHNPRPETLPKGAYALVKEMGTGVRYSTLGDNLSLRYLHVSGLVNYMPSADSYKYIPNKHLWANEEPVINEPMKKFEIRFIDPAGNREGEVVEIISNRKPAATEMLKRLWPNAKQHEKGLRIGAEVFSPQIISSVHNVGAIVSVFKIDEDAPLNVEYTGKIEVLETEIEEL